MVILSLTIILQSRQLSISATELELSRKELELTREELRRSAQAQEQSEKALRAQAEASERSARLAAKNFLLDYYESELKSVQNRLKYRARKAELERRKIVLIEILDDLFKEISGEDGGDEV